MKILVDADACPVKDLIIEIAAKVNYQVTLVSSVSHWSNSIDNNELVKYIVVDNLPEAADMKIINLANCGDVVITQDYGLAAMLLGKEVKVLSPRGKLFTDENINYLLSKRHHSAKLRRSGNKTKGPSKYSKSDRKRFERVLKEII
ncbi:YaiI/YqxD family protein [Selenihalanaerobacter shriftii]|uniref:UPF0178 protein SAMN02745118_01630 n=1 Tax=Selenihalanaerobacter shriftii TaxID=142842 RepID=A0A1T4MXU9_9FIRM|nr:YaiI/YqxD family protein [Selenihalanaerobacter shriftii]SJZ71676.1 hypothetical protein SAMN02745118_01630 [Selenihalanaerobacter shriftii]